MYCSLIWHFCSTKNKNKLESILKRALRCALDDKTSSYDDLLEKANVCKLEVERLKILAVEVYKILHSLSASYLSKYVVFNVLVVLVITPDLDCTSHDTIL